MRALQHYTDIVDIKVRCPASAPPCWIGNACLPPRLSVIMPPPHQCLALLQPCVRATCTCLLSTSAWPCFSHACGRPVPVCCALWWPCAQPQPISGPCPCPWWPCAQPQPISGPCPAMAHPTRRLSVACFAPSSVQCLLVVCAGWWPVCSAMPWLLLGPIQCCQGPGVVCKCVTVPPGAGRGVCTRVPVSGPVVVCTRVCLRVRQHLFLESGSGP